ncbi:MAG: SDR family oxidoreductase [Rhodospirillales bacterium]|jgi:NAD(P)-dependent dehydrogenase (short-subunit alcohol dehydrogenase family)|nr:SDR family oxidoreductase [Rhodospirillales bacterium]
MGETSESRRTVVITGASRGIGHATAVLFLERGWRIITCSRDDVPPSCRRDRNWTMHVPTDLADAASLDQFIAEVNAGLGTGALHALVNNAGRSPKTPYRERLGCLNGDLDAWRDVFALNFYAPLRLVRGLAGALHRGRGAVVNVTSIAGHKVHPFAGSAYSISKAALSALTRELAHECAALDIRVNAVAPGEIETEMIQPEYEVLIPRIPMERMGSPRDVAAAIFFLCSEDSGYVTGSELWITGGQHLY